MDQTQDKQTEKTWNAPNVDLESNFEKDLRTETVSAPRRVALYICKRLSSTEENDGIELSKATNNPLAGGLMMILNEGTVEYTRAEAAILYDQFLEAFAKLQVKPSWDGKPQPKKTEEELSIRWHVDYSPDHDFADILRAAGKIIKENREATGGPKTPKSWGIGMKCSYRVDKGCATFQDSVIDNKGCLLRENPWQTFFDSDLPEDEAKAKQLSPDIPYDLEKRLFNRSIVKKMDYTFEKDAVMLAETSNWGIVSELIKTVEDKIPLEQGFKILKIAGRRYGNGIQWDIIKQLNNAGLPLVEKKFYYDSEPLFNILGGPDDKLGYFFEEVEAPKCGDYDTKSLLRGYAWAVKIRYRNLAFRNYDKDIFTMIIEFWTKMQLREKQKAYKMGSEWIKTQQLMFLHTLKAEEDNLWSNDFTQHITDLIEKIAKE
tara:strand:+ start:10723 stop:12015 length:1293 start_codon:yes stop_codon:yes gene_type:complete